LKEDNSAKQNLQNIREIKGTGVVGKAGCLSLVMVHELQSQKAKCKV
jgi:hypothetical protein